ncbi:MAG: DNA repair protein RadC [Byssovorax sp.]
MNLADTSAETPSVLSGPRERALDGGIASLGDAELLAILLGTGLSGRPVSVVAAALLDGFSGVGGLLRAGPGALAAHPGIGMAKALRISAALELGRRAAQLRRPGLGPVHTSADVAAWATPKIGALDHEEMWVAALDVKNRIRASRRVAQGGLHGCSVLARDVLRAALSEAAAAIVLVHNHPSGDPSPSPEDVTTTQEIAAAASVVGMPLLDHVIVTAGGGYFSMLDKGILSMPAGR